MILSIVVVAVDFLLLLFIVLILREAEKSEKNDTHTHMNGVYQTIIYSHYDQFGFEIEVVFV